MNYYDILLAKKLAENEGGGGSSVEVESLSVTENGTYTAEQGKAFSPVNVNVPNPSTGSLSITSNNTYDVTNYASAVVNVPNPSTGSLSISANGTYDVTSYASADVNVPSQTDYTPFVEGTLSGVLDLSSVVNMIAYALYGQKNVTSVNLTSVESVGNYSLSMMDGITVFVLPSLKTFDSNVMRQCASLQKVDIGGNVTNVIGSNQWYNSAQFNTLILRKTSVIGLNNINAFQGTPFASGGTGGTLYVPQSVISSYQSATNWSTILGYANNQIKSIESTHTDPTAPIDLTLYYADGTPIGA